MKRQLLSRRYCRRLLRMSFPVVLLPLFMLVTRQVSAADGRLQLSVTGTNDKPLPCRVHIADEAGKPVRPPGVPFWRDHFVCSGHVDLKLPPGRYTFEIERGPEYAPVTGAVEIDESETKALSSRLSRIAQLAGQGWYSGDLHVHRAVKDVPLLMQAEDLHVAPVITWWNNRNLWADRALPATTLKQFDGNRFYDVLAGEDEREGGALLYFHLRQPLAITGASREYPSPMRFVDEARRRDAVWIDIEKPFWWDVPIWLASGKVDSIGLANNHMCRSRMYEDEAWGRPRDDQRLPAPRGNGYWTQEIYYHLLNCGLRLPPSAGSASGVLPNPVGYNRVYVQTGEEFTYQRWWEGLKAGRSFVTNGPLLITRADGHPPGHVFAASAGEQLEIPLEVELSSNDHIPALEIIKNGTVVKTIPVDGRSKQGKIGTISFDSSGWFLVRAIADNRRTFRFASSAPYYVEVGPEKNRISRSSAQFFVDWTVARAARVPKKLKDAAQLKQVLTHHHAARDYWQQIVDAANAE